MTKRILPTKLEIQMSFHRRWRRAVRMALKLEMHLVWILLLGMLFLVGTVLGNWLRP